MYAKFVNVLRDLCFSGKVTRGEIIAKRQLESRGVILTKGNAIPWNSGLSGGSLDKTSEKNVIETVNQLWRWLTIVNFIITILWCKSITTRVTDFLDFSYDARESSFDFADVEIPRQHEREGMQWRFSNNVLEETRSDHHRNPPSGHTSERGWNPFQFASTSLFPGLVPPFYRG